MTLPMLPPTFSIGASKAMEKVKLYKPDFKQYALIHQARPPP